MRPAASRCGLAQGKELTDRFADIAKVTAADLPQETVVDGEVVTWNGDLLDFDLLQRRMVTPVAKAAGLRRAHPASYVAFDLLAHEGTDLRRQPWAERRRQLEPSPRGWTPPLHLTPATSDVEEALTWSRSCARWVLKDSSSKAKRPPTDHADPTG